LALQLCVLTGKFLYEKWCIVFVSLQSVMKHAGKNNLKNVNSLTLGDDKPKIDTGQKISSNHHIGASPAQVSQLSFEKERMGVG